MRPALGEGLDDPVIGKDWEIRTMTDALNQLLWPPLGEHFPAQYTQEGEVLKPC